MIRLVLSCGQERIVDRMVLDAYGIQEGDTGWCKEHEDAEVQAIFAEERPAGHTGHRSPTVGD